MEWVNGIPKILSLDQFIARSLIERMNAMNKTTKPPDPDVAEKMDMDASIRNESNLNEASSDTSQPPPPVPTTNDEEIDTIRPQSPAVSMDGNLSVTNQSQSTTKSKKMKTSIGRMIATSQGKPQYTDQYNMHKSLDEFIAERCILKPKKYTTRKKQSKFARSTDSAIRKPKDGKKFPTRSISLRKDLNPFTSSLKDLVKKSVPTSENKIIQKSLVFNRAKRTFDDLISQQEGDQSFESIVNKMDNRDQVRHWPNGLTPYRAVGYLCEHGMMIEMKTGRLENNYPSDKDRLHLWQCEVTCNNITGRADSKRKEVARQIACREFLIKLRQARPHIDIPRYEIPKEVFVDPNVTKWVLDLATKQGLEVKDETVLRKLDPERRQKDDPEYLYMTTYFIGDEKFIGINPNANYSTLEAAKPAWEWLSKRSLPLTKYFVGQKCKSSNQYIFLESEVYTVLDLIEGKYDDTDGEDEFLEESLWQESNDGIHALLNQSKMANEHKRRKNEEHECRRNMKADFNPGTGPDNPGPSVSAQQGVPTTVSNESENKPFDLTFVKINVEPIKVGLGRARGRATPSNTNPF